MKKVDLNIRKSDKLKYIKWYNENKKNARMLYYELENNKHLMIYRNNIYKYGK